MKLGNNVRQLSLEDNRSLSINDILDAIDNQRARAKGSSAPIRTVISLTNHEESLIEASDPPYQFVTSEKHSTVQNIGEEDNSEGNKSMKALKTFASKSVKVTTQFQGAATRAKPKLFHYSTEHHIPQNETIRKPLLDEKNL